MLTIKQLRDLWQHIQKTRKIQLLGIVVLTLVSTIGELASIGTLIPFLAALTTPESLLNNGHTRELLFILNIENSSQIILFLTVFFTTSVIIAGISRYVLMWAQTRVSFWIGADISAEIYRKTLYQPYEVHLARNSSEIISAINTKIRDVVNQIIGPVITIVSSTFLLLSISLFLFTIDPIIAGSTFIFFGSIYCIVAILVKQKLIKHGEVIASKQNEVVRTLQEGLMGIREILLMNAQEVYLKAFQNADNPVRTATSNVIIISQAPRYAIEATGMILVALMAYILVEVKGQNTILPLLGALALGAQRMLPLLQQAYWSYSQLHGGQAILKDVLALLNQPINLEPEKINKLGFKRDIQLCNLSFSYANQRSTVLNNINLRISKGTRVGIIGETGSGKSTLIDVIMGLIVPTDGKILIDEVTIGPSERRSWRQHIAHVPQSIYLSDASVAQNIAFGTPPNQIDLKRVKHAAQQAKISEIIESWPDGYMTLVGEHGARLSGGQRQRIAIARALYREADVIILDEATSALDTETEADVMESIYMLSNNLTIIMVAHRLSTLKNCHVIYEIKNGTIKTTAQTSELQS